MGRAGLSGYKGSVRRLALRSPRRVLGWLALALLVGSPAPAFEFFEGRLELHGFAEVQLRAIARDFDRSDGVDLTQWYNVLNHELE